MKKRADGRYGRSFVIGYDAEGKQIRKSFYAKTKWEVEQKAAEWKANYEKGLELQADVSMAELADLWLESKEGMIKHQSYRNYASVVKGLSAEIGHIPARKLKVNHLVEMRNRMSERGDKKLYNRYLKFLRQVLDYGILLNLVIVNVAKSAELIKNVAKKEKRAFTPEERQMIFSADLNDYQKAFVYILFYCGLRRSEALALDVKDVDLDRRRIIINKTLLATERTIQDGTKTIAGMRHVPICNELYEVLAPYVDEVGSGLLFPNMNGNIMTSHSWDLFWKATATKIFGKDYDKNITPHMFRHNYCSDLCKAGVPVKTAMYLMGHSSMSMTMEIYSHVTIDDVDISLLEAYYKKKEMQRASVRASKVLELSQNRTFG